MPEFRQALAAMGSALPAGDLEDAPGMQAAGQPDRAEIQAFRKAIRKHKKSGSA